MIKATNAILSKSRLICFLLFTLSIFLLTGCFTGVESTPKISEKELKKQNVVDTPEKHVMDGIATTVPSQWHEGKRFYIADSRAARAAWQIEPVNVADSLQGQIAVLMRVDTVPSLTDTPEVQISLVVPAKNAKLEFRTGLTPAQWKSSSRYSLPHFIEMDVVEAAKKRLAGNTYYILPSRRIAFNGSDTLGTRYQPVTVTDVLPATEATPLQVFFADNENHISSILMTLGDATTSRRNFETIFALTDPRQRFKHIPDDTWELIRHGKLREGMTSEEARLALGQPDSYKQIPTTGGMVEQWNFMNGVYLVFEDGVLTRFRQ